jgi:hypothetical protein
MENKIKDKLITSIMSLGDDSKQGCQADLEKLSIERLRHILLFRQTMRIESKLSSCKNDDD